MDDLPDIANQNIVFHNKQHFYSFIDQRYQEVHNNYNG